MEESPQLNRSRINIVSNETDTVPLATPAFGVGRDSIADALAGDCPVSPFFASTAQVGVLPGEERVHPDARLGILSAA